MEFWRAWSIPASGPEFPQAGLMDSLETVDGEIRISIRVLNVDTPEANSHSLRDETNPS